MPSPLAHPLAAEAERLYAVAAEATAPLLWSRAKANGRSYVTERFELQPTFKTEVERAAASVRPRPSVSPRLKADLRRYYTAIGPFDISLDWPGHSA